MVNLGHMPLLNILWIPPTDNCFSGEDYYGVDFSHPWNKFIFLFETSLKTGFLDLLQASLNHYCDSNPQTLGHFNLPSYSSSRNKGIFTRPLNLRGIFVTSLLWQQTFCISDSLHQWVSLHYFLEFLPSLSDISTLELH